MWRLYCLIFILSFQSAIYAQDGSYNKAIAAYEAQHTDSAWWYIDKAIVHFKRVGQTDSLVLAYTQKADMAWYEESVQRGLQLIDSALSYKEQLPYQSIAVIAALNKKGQIHVNNAAPLEGKKYFSEALRRVSPGAAPNDVFARLYTNIAWMHLNLQELDEGIVYGEKARRMIEAMYGTDSKMLTSVYQTLMYLAHDANLFTEAEHYALEMFRLVEKHLPPQHTSRALAHNDLGTLYETMYKTDDALYHRQQMVNITQAAYRKTNNPHLLSIGYNNMGKLYEALGEWQLANDYYEKACRLHAKNYGPDGIGMVRPLSHLANLKRLMGNFEEADSLFTRALRIQMQLEPGDRQNIAYVETMYGDLLFDKKMYQQSTGYYQRALNYQEKVKASAADATRTTLGRAYVKLGRWKEGLALLEQSLLAYRKVYPAGHIVIAGQLHKISEAWLDNNDAETAMRYSDSTFLELLQSKQFPEGNWIDKLPYYHFVIGYIQHRVNIESHRSRQSGNNSYLRNIQVLADHYSDYLEKILPALRTQASLIQLAAQHKQIYDAAIEACWHLYQNDRKQEWLEKAFSFSETAKSLMLRLASNNILIDAAGRATDADAKEDLSWRKRIAQLNAQYLDNRNDDSLLTQLTAAMESYYVFQEKRLKANKTAAQLKYRMHAASIPEIRRHLLRGGQTMLQYSVTEESIFLFVLNRDHFRVHRLSRSALETVSSIRNLYNLSPAAFAQPAYRLYQELVAPAIPSLLSNKLLIVPDDELHYLNFELLLSSEKPAGFKDMPYLLRDFEISTLLSATSTIHFAQVSRRASRRALLLAPVFTDEMKASYQAAITDSLLLDRQYLSLLRQPFTIDAARQIARFLSSDLLSGQAALESSFKQKAGDYRILHLGTHAEINNYSPMQSRLFLAKSPAEEETGEDDGYLHAYEIYALSLQADLVVLNACETGIGRWSKGEGVISLAHSFMHAGCPSVVMTLWKTDEKTSADVVTLFYRKLADGLSKGEALRLAKLEYLRKAPAGLANPYFWAGMTLVGDSEPVMPAGKRWWFTAVFAIGFLIALIIGIRARSVRSLK